MAAAVSVEVPVLRQSLANVRANLPELWGKEDTMTPSMTLTVTADSPLIQSIRDDINRRCGAMAAELVLLRKLEDAAWRMSQREQGACDDGVQAALDDLTAWRKQNDTEDA